MKYPKLRELKEAVIALIKGPYTNNFPFKPSEPELRFRGRPVPHEEDCIGCGACANLCPGSAIRKTDHLDATPPYRQLTWEYDQCIFCGQCQRLCTTRKGVVLSNKEYDLAVLDRKQLSNPTESNTIKKELQLCENCGEVIAPKDQIKWVATQLKELIYGNLLAFSWMQKVAGFSEKPAVYPQGRREEEPFSRPDVYRIVCPKCRRRLHLFDEYGIKE
ncbi:MAG: 4Fe-4S dicluster domain-containing protein [Elusimicrobiota bacterium]